MPVTRYNYDIVIHHRINIIVYVPITTALGLTGELRKCFYPSRTRKPKAQSRGGPSLELVNDDAVVDSCKCA